MVVDGKTYNVGFIYNVSYNAVYSGTPPAFLNNSTGATAAAIALSSALNGLLNSSSSSSQQFDVFIPSVNNPNQVFSSFTGVNTGLQVYAKYDGTAFTYAPYGVPNSSSATNPSTGYTAPLNGYTVFNAPGQVLNNFPGGPGLGNAISLPGTTLTKVGGVPAEYYQFYWPGGFFGASASVTGAPITNFFSFQLFYDKNPSILYSAP